MPGPLEPGQRVDDFIVIDALGAGANGSVWKVEHVGTRAPYALKLLAPERRPQDRERFRREIEALARVDGHPHLIRVHTAGTHQGLPYVVLEELEGGDLRERLRRGPLPPREAAEIVEGLARGVSHAHAQGVLHRDIKPANVLFDAGGVPKLADFGLAGGVDAHSLTQTGQLIGSPAYMAPEQVTGNVSEIDERTDVYALGAVLYEALTGQVPFPGHDLLTLSAQILNAVPDPPSRVVPDVPRSLDLICLRALAKDRAHRFPTAAALADALRDRSSAPAPRRVGAAIAAAVALGAAALLMAYAWRYTPGPEVAEAPSPTGGPQPTPVASPAVPTPTSAPSPPLTPSASPTLFVRNRDSRAAAALATLTDPARARQLAAQGDPIANRHLAVLAENQGDYPTALRHYLVSAKADDLVALRSVAEFYHGGRPGIRIDLKRALRWFKRAARLGDRRAMIRVVEAYRGKWSPDLAHLTEARRWLERLAGGQDPEAWVEAATVMFGRGPLRDPARATTLLEAAVRMGSADACVLKGKRTLKQDRAHGLDLLRAGVKRRSRKALFVLGTALLDGDPTPAEREEALAALRRSAVKHRNADSMLRLYEELRGSSDEADRAEAQRHLETAARKGSDRARKLLGRSR